MSSTVSTAGLFSPVMLIDMDGICPLPLPFGSKADRGTIRSVTSLAAAAQCLCSGSKATLKILSSTLADLGDISIRSRKSLITACVPLGRPTGRALISANADFGGRPLRFCVDDSVNVGYVVNEVFSNLELLFNFNFIL